MSILEAGLLSVGAGLICLAIAVRSNSRKLYLQEQKMSRLEEAVSKVEANDAAQDTQLALNAQQAAEKDAIIQQLRDDASGAMSLDQQHALAERLERLLGPVASTTEQTGTPVPSSGDVPANETETVNPVSGETPDETTLDGVQAEPVVENGEVIGGVLHDDTGPTGDAAIDRTT